MSNEQPIVENLRDSPDVAVLKQIESPIVVVTKISATGKRSGNQLIVKGATGMSWQEILDLHDQILNGQIANGGPGLYKFEVTDQNTTAKVAWQTRLIGPGEAEEMPAPSALPMARSPFRPNVVPLPVNTAAAPPSRSIPPAADAQNLGNGWIYNPSLDLLTAPDGSMHSWRKNQPLPTISTPLPSSTVSAVTVPPMATFAGSTAANPEFETMRQTLAATQAALAEAKEREREAARQREIRELQERMERATAENNARFEALVAKLTETKPNNEVEELKRRLEERDREDSRQREIERLRSEMKTQLEGVMALVRETSSKGPDPVVGVLTQMLADQRHAADLNVQSMRELMAQERAAARETTLTPDKIITMLERQAAFSKDDTKEAMASRMFSMIDMMTERMMKFTQMERELGGGGGGVDWMGIIRDVGKQVGSAVQMFQAVKAREAAAAAAASQAEAAKAAAITATAQAQARAHALPARPAAPAAPAAATAAAPEPAVGRPKKPRVTVVPPSLSEAKPSELRALFKGETDEQFFGTALEFVQQLREEVATKPSTTSAEDIAGYILQARALLEEEAKKGNVSHAAELLVHGQFAYLLERLLPNVAEGLRSEVVKALKDQLQAEADAIRIEANRKKGSPAS
jgi:hypothetical protein